MRGLNAQPGSFQDDPLAFLDTKIKQQQECFWLSPNELCIGKPELGKAILANAQQQFSEHSDFFRSRRGFLQPRHLQQQLSRDAASLLSQYVKQQQTQLPARLHQHFYASSPTASQTKAAFPDSANLLMLELLGPVLVRPGSAPAVEQCVQQITHRTILRGRGLKPPPATGFWFRMQVIHRLGKELHKRAKHFQHQPDLPTQDLLDVIARHAGPEYPSDQLAQVMLSFIVATISSIGFLFAWSVYLLGRHALHQSAEPESCRHIVLEALRLWPIAWLFGRQVQQDCEIEGHSLKAGQEVIICPYVSQRSERYWSGATDFIPQRWNDSAGERAFFPFGWGEHRCTASGVSIALVSDLLQVLLEHYRLQYHFEGAQACVGVALSPPYFELELTALGSVTYSMRNTVCKGFSAQC